jgi:beta-glucanase (GH16 family)
MDNIAIEESRKPAIIRPATGIPLPLIFQSRRLKLVFNDEFDGAESLSPHWSRTYFWGGRTLPTNKEEQVYTDRAFLQQRQSKLGDSGYIRDGYLALRAERLGPDEAQKVGASYSSGLVTTYNSFVFRYGVVEVRAQPPKGKGLWSALWLLRKDKGSNGEIDIMEILGDRPDFLNVTLHMGGSGAAGINRFVRQKVADLSAGYHVYTLMWSEREIAIALDGIELTRTATPEALKGDMYLLMNLAVGGKWPGSPNQTTPFPAEFKIDYVRIWQEALDNRP